MTHRIALALVLLAAPAAAETPAEFVRLPEPAGLGRLLRPVAPKTPPLVLLLPDALGADGREELYADTLLARGIASLAIGLREDADAAAGDSDPAASPHAVAPVLDWAARAGFGPVAVMGFGLGGRAALAGGGALPAVALYPGCAALPLAATGPLLILQGGDAAAGCAALPQHATLELRLLPGTGHGWDAPGALWPSPGPVLPDPAGGGRLRARTDPEAMRAAAEAAAAWLEQALLARRLSAAE